MNAEPRPRALALAVQPLDEQSRRLVPRANGLLLEERTVQREEELPSTEPDGAAIEGLRPARDPAISALRLLQDQKQKTERDVQVPEPVESILAKEKPTEPARPTVAPSDVFAPLGSHERVADSEAATPRDRPSPNVHERATALDPQRDAATLTMQGRPYAPQSERTEPIEQARHERESNHERVLVESIYDSERAFMSLNNRDPQRAADIVSLSDHLKATGQLTDRDMVLAAHAREKVALPTAARDLREGHEDRVMAYALIGRELDDRYRDQMKVEKEKLLGELEALPAEKRGEVFADFESFAERDAANDSNFCRREMHKALREEREELHRAYVYALALDKKQARVAASVPTIVADGDGVDGGERR